MVQPAISFQQVCKRFAFGTDKPQTILETVVSKFTHRQQEKKPLWAVRDLSFEVMPGESWGLIGRNGSGKSTVLKLAARILRPTSGQVAVNGRMSALLELGAGFHPDLTGRENVFLNGSVLGLGKRELLDRFEAIVAFSELEEFIDMPVKHYSSGMYMRLGFSVAVHVDPQILIVDEILAVGDYAFQIKCLERIRSLQRQGTTVVMVSHHLPTIRNLCSHVLWMDHGQLQGQGEASEVFEAYIAALQGQRPLLGHEEGFFNRWGTGEIEIVKVRFVDDAGTPRTHFAPQQPFTIEIYYHAHQPVHNPEFGLAIFHPDGTNLLAPNNRQAGVNMGVVEGKGVVHYRLERLPLVPAQYRVTVAIHDTHQPRAFDFHEQAYQFQIIRQGEPPQGLFDLPAQWQITSFNDELVINTDHDQ